MRWCFLGLLGLAGCGVPGPGAAAVDSATEPVAPPGPSSSSYGCPETLPPLETTSPGCVDAGLATDLDTTVEAFDALGASCPGNVCPAGSVHLLVTVVNPCDVDIDLPNGTGLVHWEFDHPDGRGTSMTADTTTRGASDPDVTVLAHGALDAGGPTFDARVPGMYRFGYVELGGPAAGTFVFCVD